MVKFFSHRNVCLEPRWEADTTKWVSVVVVSVVVIACDRREIRVGYKGEIDPE